MEIEDTPIYKEIRDIIKEGPKPIATYYKAKIHAGDETFEGLKITSVNIIRDYITRAADIVTISVVIPMGLWAKKLYKYRTDLEITLTKTILKEVSETPDEEEDIESHRYFAVPDPSTMPIMDSRDVQKLSIAELDLLNILTVDFQLTEKLVHQLRLMTVGGTFRKTTPADVVKYILATESSKIKVEEDSTFKGVHLIDPHNKEKREHILIPQGTNIVDLPVYAQKRVGGIYNTGIGCYYQNRYWFVYPLYDTTRLEKEKKTLTIIKVPVLRHTGIERTYRKEGDTVYLIGTSDAAISNDALTNFTDSGNGTRFADTRRYMRDLVKVEDNKAKSSRKKNNHEFVVVDRKENKNSVFMSPRKLNANPFAERSALTAKHGGVLQLIWENSDHTLLFPGMMCKIHYLDNNKVKEIHGVLLGNEVAIQINSFGLTTTKHTTTTLLSIFVNKPKDKDEEIEEDDERDTKEIARWAEYKAF